MIVDKVGNELKVGDLVRCEGLEYEIESFTETSSGFMACGRYGCISVGLVVRVWREGELVLTSFGADWVP
jgi:hypothetical protein